MTDSPALVLAGHPLLEFQPAVDLATGRLLGFEALVRWSHPTRGHISPAILIPWAEANGDIIPLNAWVLSEACRQAQLWPSGIQLAVNCSIVQLRRGEASLAVEHALDSSGLNPDRLTIEITEHTIADERAAADLRALTAMGVHLAVDDVGTMWSSLNSLRRFAIETVKIDAAFIANLEADEGMNRAIVDAIVHVGHSLAMSAVAEGVETETQVAILREFGTDVAQGYFFARPMSSHDTLELANTEPRPVYPLTAPRPGEYAGTPEDAGAPDEACPAADAGTTAAVGPRGAGSRGLVLLTSTPPARAAGGRAGPETRTAPLDGREAGATGERGAAADPRAAGDPGETTDRGAADPRVADTRTADPRAAADGGTADRGASAGGHRRSGASRHADPPGPEPGVRLPANVAEWTDPDVGEAVDGSATA